MRIATEQDGTARCVVERSYYDTACGFLSQRAETLSNRLPLFEPATADTAAL